MAKKQQTKETVRITVDLPHSMYLQFTLMATLQGKSKADLIRAAIEQMINAPK